MDKYLSSPHSQGEYTGFITYKGVELKVRSSDACLLIGYWRNGEWFLLVPEHRPGQRFVEKLDYVLSRIPNG